MFCGKFKISEAKNITLFFQWMINFKSTRNTLQIHSKFHDVDGFYF